jgi:hypothetical protein
MAPERTIRTIMKAAVECMYQLSCIGEIVPNRIPLQESGATRYVGLVLKRLRPLTCIRDKAKLGFQQGRKQ